MRRLSLYVAFFAAAASLGVMACGTFAKAEVLDESTVSITYALNEYVNSLNIVEIKEEEVAESADDEKTCRYPEFEGKCLAYVDEAVNVRAEPDEESERVGSLPVHGIALVAEKGETWTKIESGITMGYVRNDFLLFGDTAGAYAEETCPKKAKVNTETLYVRAGQDEGSDCLTMVGEGESYEVIQDDTVDEWVHIRVDSDIEGYVSAQYVDVSYGFSHALSVAEEEEIRKKKEEEEAARLAEMTSSRRQEVVNFALQFLGNPYVYGGTSLTNGTDCSGFTMSVYAHFGYGLPRTAAQQMAGLTNVPLDSIQPGDLLFYRDKSGAVGHVTMYIGGGQVVHASSSTTGIIISGLGYRTPCGAARVIWD